MKRTLMALAAVATLAVSALAVPAPAHAQRGVGVGIAAGLLGGAIIGGAIASSPYYYGPGYYPGYRPYAITAVPPTSPMIRMAAATGSVSVSGTATAGGCATYGSAADPFIFIKTAGASRKTTNYPGAYALQCPKKTAFSDHEARPFTFR